MLLFVFTSVTCQVTDSIRVVDADTREASIGVALISLDHDHQALTSDLHGILRLEGLSNDELVQLTQIGYEFTFAKMGYLKMQDTIFLQPQAQDMTSGSTGILPQRIIRVLGIAHKSQYTKELITSTSRKELLERRQTRVNDFVHELSNLYGTRKKNTVVSLTIDEYGRLLDFVLKEITIDSSDYLNYDYSAIVRFVLRANVNFGSINTPSTASTKPTKIQYNLPLK